MKYDIKYSDDINQLIEWKNTLLWKKAINDNGLEVWSGSENIYKNLNF